MLTDRRKPPNVWLSEVKQTGLLAMHECYADGWDGRAYQHVVIFLNAGQAQCTAEVSAEFYQLYGYTPEFVLVVPIEMERICA